MAVQFWLNQGQRRTKFVSFRHGYHGDTFATMAICDPEEGMHKMFRGVLPEQLSTALPGFERKPRCTGSRFGRKSETSRGSDRRTLDSGGGRNEVS